MHEGEGRGGVFAGHYSIKVLFVCILTECMIQSNSNKCIYYPVDISTTVFSYSRAVQYHAILHGTGVIARALGLRGILATTMCFN